MAMATGVAALEPAQENNEGGFREGGARTARRLATA